MITSINEFKLYLEQFQLIPDLRLVNNNIEYKDYSNINWEDIELIEASDDGNTIIHLDVKLPGDDKICEGIVLDIQLINDELYHPHISIAENLQKQGLVYKVYLKFIHEFGHRYSTQSRVTNKIVINSINNKLSNTPDIDYFKTNTGGEIWILKTNPDYDYLINKYVK